MTTQDPRMMQSLDARLASLHASLDTSPGFDARLADRIAGLRTKLAQAKSAAVADDTEAEFQTEWARADWQARVETLILAAAAVPALLAVWHFAPAIEGWMERVAGSMSPDSLAGFGLATAVALVYGVMRHLDIDPRSLIRG